MAAGADTADSRRSVGRIGRTGCVADAPVEGYSTPRRLTARIAKIAERQTDLEELLTGPPVGGGIRR